MSQRKHLYLIRHVESIANLSPDIVNGRSNESPISVDGPQQANDIAASLVEQGIFPNRVFVSPAVRTLTTARLVLRGMGVYLRPVIDGRIQELDQGEFTGRARSHVYTPDVIARGEREGKDFRPAGGESMNDVSKRMMQFIREISRPGHAEVKESESVFVFTHGVAIRCVASHILGWSRKQTFEAQTPNASVTLVTGQSDDWTVEYIGRTHEQSLLPSHVSAEIAYAPE